MTDLDKAHAELASLLEERARLNDQAGQIFTQDNNAEEFGRLHRLADKSYRKILAVQARIRELGGVVDGDDEDE